MIKSGMRNIGLLAMLCVVGLILACKKESIVVGGMAKVRFVNAYLSADPQEFYQDETKLTSQAVLYGEHTDYLNVNAGKSTFWSNGVVENKPTAVADVILYNDYVYTLFYCEDKNFKPAIVGYINDKKAPAAGKYRVRFVNLSMRFDDKPLVVVGLNNVAAGSELNYGDNPLYHELSVGGEVKVNIKDSNMVTVLDKSKFREGKSYLVWFDTSDNLEVGYHVVAEN